jgi:ABC-type nitrate/sulfonate/bicarbonate transport system substrate-binding protein
MVASNVTFSLSPGSLTNLAEYVGLDMGYFQKYGIGATKIASSSGSFTLQLLETNKLDFGAINIPSTILAAQTSKVDLRVAVGMETHYPAALVCNKSSGVTGSYPAGVKQLVGKTIATDSPVSSSTADLYISLKANGINPSQTKITYISTGASATVAALQANRVDCAMVYEPTQNELGNTVNTVIDIENGKCPPLVNQVKYNVLTVNNSYAQQNPKVVTAAQKAMVAITDLISDPANADTIAKGVAADYPGLSETQLATLIKHLAPTFKDGAAITQAQFAASLQVYNQANNKNLNVSYSDIVLPMAS